MYKINNNIKFRDNRILFLVIGDLDICLIKLFCLLIALQIHYFK